MSAVLRWTGDVEKPVPVSLSSSQSRTRGRRTPVAAGQLPPEIESAVWRGTELGHAPASVLRSGFDALDAELPGAGWPCHALTEILQPQPTVTEWRLLAPAIRQVVAAGHQVVAVGPPKTPHLPGLRFAGVDERQIVWIQAETPSERLWVTEQLVRSNAAGLLVAWIPQVRQEQIRRLQICAAACDGPVFLCRPAAAEFESSAAPLRLQVRVDVDWALSVQILKRRGPTHEGLLRLPSVPGGLAAVLTPRLLKPSELLALRRAQESEVSRAFLSDVVGGPAPRQPPVRRISAH